MSFAEPLLLFFIAGFIGTHFHRHVVARAFDEPIHQIKNSIYENTKSRKTSFRKIKTHAAFTLVEIMLVVAIIGILAALVIPKIAGKSEAGARHRRAGRHQRRHQNRT